MPIIQWNTGFLIGIQEVDHQHLVQLLNRVYDEFRGGANIEQSVLRELLSKAADHFVHEERLMAESSYPKIVEHTEEHELFSCRISDSTNNYKKNERISVELLWFLCNWVTHHIRETDAEFGRFPDVRNGTS